MKFQRPRPKVQCAAIIEPGEFTIDQWDGQQCGEDNPWQLTQCDICLDLFCLITHWHKHVHTMEVLPCPTAN